MNEVVNASKLAKIFGTSRAAISKAVASGRLVPIHVQENGRMLFDLATAEAAWGDRPNAKQTRSDREKGAAISDGIHAQQARAPRELTGNQKLTKAKIAREVYTAAMKRIEIEEKQGTLISVEKVREDGANLGRILLGALTAMPSRLHQQLAVMTDPRAIYDLLDEEIAYMIVSIRKACGLDDDGDDEADMKKPD